MPPREPLIGEVWQLNAVVADNRSEPELAVVLRLEVTRVMLLARTGRTVTVPMRSFLLGWSFSRPKSDAPCSIPNCPEQTVAMVVFSDDESHWQCSAHVPPSCNVRLPGDTAGGQIEALQTHCPYCGRPNNTIQRTAGGFAECVCPTCSCRWASLWLPDTDHAAFTRSITSIVESSGAEKIAIRAGARAWAAIEKTLHSRSIAGVYLERDFNHQDHVLIICKPQGNAPWWSGNSFGSWWQSRQDRTEERSQLVGTYTCGNLRQLILAAEYNSMWGSPFKLVSEHELFRDWHNCLTPTRFAGTRASPNGALWEVGSMWRGMWSGRTVTAEVIEIGVGQDPFDVTHVTVLARVTASEGVIGSIRMTRDAFINSFLPGDLPFNVCDEVVCADSVVCWEVRALGPQGASLRSSSEEKHVTLDVLRDKYRKLQRKSRYEILLQEDEADPSGVLV
jgi:hypothetical protein